MSEGYRLSIIERAQRSLEKDGILGGSPLGVLAVEETFDLARTAAGRRDNTSDVFKPFDLAKRYCEIAHSKLAEYDLALRRWKSLPRAERPDRPRKIYATDLAEELSDDVGRSQAIDRLNAARHPLLLNFLGLTDPLDPLGSSGRASRTKRDPT